MKGEVRVLEDEAFYWLFCEGAWTVGRYVVSPCGSAKSSFEIVGLDYSVPADSTYFERVGERIMPPHA